MYIVTRIWETKPLEARRAATLAALIGEVYEKAGQRSSVQVSFNGGTLPGETNRVYMRWIDDKIESPYRGGNEIPEKARELGAKLIKELSKKLKQVEMEVRDAFKELEVESEKEI